jgi:hypothetical protein
MRYATAYTAFVNVPPEDTEHALQSTRRRQHDRDYTMLPPFSTYSVERMVEDL